MAKGLDNGPPPLYSPGDFVLIEKIYIIRNSLVTHQLETPIVARVKERKGRTSFGYPYLLDFAKDDLPDNIAKVCYWEDDILCITEDPDELIWKIWGDQ